MVEDEEILELVHRDRGDLQKAVKALVAAANRGGGEDNITAVAFRVSAQAAPNLEDTMAMPAITDEEAEPDERTREYDEELRADTMVVPPGQIPEELASAEPEAPPVADKRRVRVVLAVLLLLAIAAVVLAWGLTR
jgi:hypothetical protein